MKRTISFLLLLLVAKLTATGHFEFNDAVRDAYEQATSLRFREAQLSLSQLKSEEPNNFIVYHIENYIDFLTLYLNQSETDYKRLKNNEEARIAKLQSGDSNSPYYLFAQADVRLQWALVKLRFGDYFSGFGDISKANKLLQKNQEKFPDFLPNLKDLGVLHALAGTVPDNYKWGVRLLSGIEGSIEKGRKELSAVFQHGKKYDFVFKEEATVMYASVLLYLENDGETAWQVLQSADLQPDSNPLHCFVMANVAMRAGRNDKAITLLQQRPRGTEFAQIPQLDYMLGLAKLRRLDRDAGQYFLQFLARNRSSNGIKEAYQKLAWSELINDNSEGYRRYIAQVIAKGKSNTGGDRDALEEAQSHQVASVCLIKARLLFDGGYYQKAYQQLEHKALDNFSDKHDRIEYTYRLGRILHGLERYDEAINYYRQTIEQGRNEPYFYACNAALQAGLICETRRDSTKAREFYLECLRIDPDEYKTELHQKAKSGLDRLK